MNGTVLAAYVGCEICRQRACQRLRRMTREAGRLTPAASVLVAISTASAPDRYPRLHRSLDAVNL